MKTKRSYDVVDNFKFIATFSTLKEAQDFITKSAKDYDIMAVDTPVKRKD